MKVYLLWCTCYPFNLEILHGLYTTREKAEKVLTEKQMEYDMNQFEFHIEERLPQ